MKRLWIAAALLLSLGQAGCRLFEPEQPVYYPQVYCPPCPQVCAPVASQCLPAATYPATTPVPRQQVLPR